MPPFPLKTTTHIIYVYMALHNFIRRNDIGDEEFILFNENVELDYDVEIDENILEDVTWKGPN